MKVTGTTLLYTVKGYRDNTVVHSEGTTLLYTVKVTGTTLLNTVKGYRDNIVVHSEGLQGQHCCTQ